MKIVTKLIAAALAASLSAAAAFPVSAACTPAAQSAVVTAENEESVPVFTDDEEMLSYVRSQMKLRNENIKALMSGADDKDIEKYADMISDTVFEYTGDPTEGKYLYLSLVDNSSMVYITNGGVMIEYNTKYRTTAEQEKEVDKAFEDLVSLISGKFPNNMEGVPQNERVVFLYNSFVSSLKEEFFTDDTEPDILGSAYSVMFVNKGNELGFIQLFIRMLAEFGIHTELYFTNIDFSNPLGAHYVVLAEIDGTYYITDPIWDYKAGSSDNDHKFLLKGMNDLDSDIPEGSEFTHRHFTIFDITLQDLAEAVGISMYAYDKKFEFGDVNGDGRIDSVDASAILSEYARLSSSDKNGIFSAGQKSAADIDGNGAYDSVDASTILSYYSYASTHNDGLTLEQFAAENNRPS